MISTIKTIKSNIAPNRVPKQYGSARKMLNSFLLSYANEVAKDVLPHTDRLCQPLHDFAADFNLFAFRVCLTVSIRVADLVSERASSLKFTINLSED